MVKFQILGKVVIFYKNSRSLVIQIYARQDGGISLIKRFLGYAFLVGFSHFSGD